MIRKRYAWLVLLLLAIGIKIFSLNPSSVERYYSNGLYPIISKVQRFLLGWIPFSIGDLFYLAVGIWLIYKLVQLIRKLRRRQADWNYWKGGLRLFLFITLFIYVSFSLLWGLNYNRVSIATQLQLDSVKMEKQSLIELMQHLAYKLNASDSLGRIDRKSLRKKKHLFNEASDAYDLLSKSKPNFQYKLASVKPSIFSYLGNYLGFTGYYNPYSGEAQVNTTVPHFVQPFTTCHEIGHQLGYAKENEANFAGFLSARSSDDPAFRYSVYFELYSYGRRFLYAQDSMELKRLDSQLNVDVKNDFRELRKFWIKHENPVERVVDRLYGQYLKANEQPAGKVTYSRVIFWLLAYYRKYGKEAI